jgi:hypothetical protein
VTVATGLAEGTPACASIHHESRRAGPRAPYYSAAFQNSPKLRRIPNCQPYPRLFCKHKLKLTMLAARVGFAPRRLPNRRVLDLAGPDTVKLLQSLCTNDVSRWWNERDTKALATAFLSTKGRILADCILHAPLVADAEPRVLLDCDAAVR